MRFSYYSQKRESYLILLHLCSLWKYRQAIDPSASSDPTHWCLPVLGFWYKRVLCNYLSHYTGFWTLNRMWSEPTRSQLWRYTKYHLVSQLQLSPYTKSLSDFALKQAEALTSEGFEGKQTHTMNYSEGPINGTVYTWDSHVDGTVLMEPNSTIPYNIQLISGIPM